MLKLTLVDVFGNGPMTGNQLAVVQGATGLASETMQAIATEMNFSETTFVVDESTGRARVRIFTPADEIPFAGHPTLGTAWVVAKGRRSIALELPIGDVQVEFRDRLAWLTAPATRHDGTIPVTEAASLVGLTPEALDPTLGHHVVECGLRYWLIGIRDLASLRNVRVALNGRTDMAVFAVCREPYTDAANFAARMLWNDGRSDREDPATGSANAAFADHLRLAGISGRFVVEQGFEIGRPSGISLEIADAVKVGGRVGIFAEGRIDDTALT